MFDGLGGREGSEYAAQLASMTIGSLLSRKSTTLSPDSARQIAEHSFDEANHNIQRAQKLGRRGIATTAIIAQVYTHPKSQKQFIQMTHCGDPRGYVYRDGDFAHITLDHAYMDEDPPIEERMSIQQELSDMYRIDEVDPYYWRYLYERNIIDACLDGKSPLTVSSSTVSTVPDDIILLTSDGIHDNLTTQEICDVIKTHGCRSPQYLVESARERSREPRDGTIEIEGETYDVNYFRPKPDDMTAVARLVHPSH